MTRYHATHAESYHRRRRRRVSSRSAATAVLAISHLFFTRFHTVALGGSPPPTTTISSCPRRYTLYSYTGPRAHRSTGSADVYDILSVVDWFIDGDTPHRNETVSIVTGVAMFRVPSPAPRHERVNRIDRIYRVVDPRTDYRSIL